MNEGEFEGSVRSLSSEGWGVVTHPDGRVFFVPGTWPGDEGKFSITRVEKRYGYARLVQLLRPAPARKSSVECSHSGLEPGKCGGCPWMFVEYDQQVTQKEHRLRFALERAKLWLEGMMLPTLRAPNTFGWRNRAQFKTDGEEIGYVSRESNVLAPIDDCLILTTPMRERFNFLKSMLPKEQWKASGGRPWSSIDVDEHWGIDEPVALNRRRPFQQGHTAQNLAMKSWLRERLQGTSRNLKVLELFCGSGNFTSVFVAEQFQEITSVEVVPIALDQIRISFPKVTAWCLDLSKPWNFRRLAEKNPNVEILFLDPPRDGAKGLGEATPLWKNLKKILYVSCDLATFVREAADIHKNSTMRLSSVQLVDMFPHTPHLELLAEFLPEQQS